ncbi:MAG: ATP-binding protein [Clostridiaceae bacterium]
MSNRFKSDKKVQAVLSKVTRYMDKAIEGILSKIRLSIVLKLNFIYIIRMVGLLITLDIFILSVYAYVEVREAQKEVISSTMVISGIMQESTEFPEEKINIIASAGNTNYHFYDSQDNLIYENNSEIPLLNKTILKISERNYLKTSGNGYFVNPSLSKWKEGLVNINYVYEDSVNFKDSIIKVTAEYNLKESLYLLKNEISVIVLSEIILLLLSLIKITATSKKILKPIDEMNNTVKNITINQLDTRLNISGSQNELKDLAATFNDVLDRIQRAHDVQSQFVSDASHELRTPISVIQGYAKLLDRWGKEDKEVLQESIDAIKSEAENMKRLVEELLFLARGDKNAQEINFKSFSLKSLMEEILKDTLLIDKNHYIELKRNEEVDFYGDEKLIKQTIRIFIDNSIKYTPEGGKIVLEAYKENDQLFVTIEDNGIGIAEEELPKIFDRFYRSDKSRTRETGGTGLGLSIAKWIIMKHRGQISVSSAHNKGTKIIISFSGGIDQSSSTDTNK